MSFGLPKNTQFNAITMQAHTFIRPNLSMEEFV